jgi:hypothetical protein
MTSRIEFDMAIVDFLWPRYVSILYLRTLVMACPNCQELSWTQIDDLSNYRLVVAAASLSSAHSIAVTPSLARRGAVDFVISGSRRALIKDNSRSIRYLATISWYLADFASISAPDIKRNVQA